MLFFYLNTMKNRCQWCEGDPQYVNYHDKEWGVPVRDEQKQFEFLTLEIFQAGLSWITVLRKRENFRKAFDQFDFHKVAKYKEDKIQALMKDAGLIRNQLKIKAALNNAKCFTDFQKKGGSFTDYLWGFVNYRPIQNNYEKQEDIPSKSSLSQVISKNLKKRGFKFVGPTIIYAHLQATGIVNDHLTTCFRHQELKG